MNSGFGRVKEILQALIDGYKKIIKIAEKERIFLVEVNSDGILKIVEEKKEVINELLEAESDLKEILDTHNVENINEFLFFASEHHFVDDIRILNGELQEKIREFKLKDEINRMIATEHLKFFNGLLNIYTNILVGENYDKDATRKIKTNLMNLRV